MSQKRIFGFQWRLAIIYLVVGAAGAIATLSAYQAGRYYDLGLLPSLAVGFGAGMFCGLVGAFTGSKIARSVKLRLWEAGRMAARISRGDYRARLAQGPDDEVGWLEEQLNQMAAQLEKAVASLRDLAEQNRRLGEEAGRGAVLEERMRLARDLHDTVNQQLFVLAMRSAALKQRLERMDSGAASLVPEMAELEKIAREAHSQIRELILQIRPVTLEKEGLGAALNEYIKNVGEREDWEIIINIDQLIFPDSNLGEGLFRIAQEALNNISKHADAGQVKVALSRKEGYIELIIADDGVGFDLKETVDPTTVGISGIKERAAQMEGTVNIESARGEGTRLKVVVPGRSGIEERSE